MSPIKWKLCRSASAKHRRRTPRAGAILSQREFGSVHGPTSWDLFGSESTMDPESITAPPRRVARHPMGATILFWAVIIAAVVWVAMALFRYWTRRAP